MPKRTSFMSDDWLRPCPSPPHGPILPRCALLAVVLAVALRGLLRATAATRLPASEARAAVTGEASFRSSGDPASLRFSARPVPLSRTETRHPSSAEPFNRPPLPRLVVFALGSYYPTANIESRFTPPKDRHHVVATLSLGASSTVQREPGQLGFSAPPHHQH